MKPVQECYFLGKHVPDVEATLAEIAQRGMVERIWRKDHTVWKPDPDEIANRLGWLTVPDLMREQVPALESFARDIRDDGYSTVVLLGMGGSSLGPEVMRQTYGSTSGYPELIVLDSTVPASVQAVTDGIDPKRTLFVASSKSGSTIETVCLLDYFRGLTEQVVGKQSAERNFVAITDPGTPLAAQAEEEGFRRVFLNPPDIGGRYSVLSYFGLVPAALMGLDIGRLIDQAERMREACAWSQPVRQNPGASLGAIIGSLAARGRDKLTLVMSPAIGSFGLWVEQLLAESTGKEGRGIIPVDGEPLVPPASYGDDRLFIYLRLKGDANSGVDAAVERIKSLGQPVVALDIADKYDLGGEFFRWEFATAVAGALLGINPFDQPDVQRAKDATQRVLQEYVAAGSLPKVENHGSLVDLLAGDVGGRYFAIMAYIHQTPEADKALADLRSKVVARYRIATTLGYGPRFLHSTGQMHKGGPDTGLFLQITTGHKRDMSIPGKPYTFGVLADAEALGDLQALHAAGRRVVEIRVSEGDLEPISRLASDLA